MEKQKKEFKVPHIYVMIFTIICIMTVLTYIIPAGQYSLVPGPNGRQMIDPNSFTRVPQTPVNLYQLFTSIPIGLRDANDLIFAILTIGGLFEVLKRCGVIETFASLLVKAFSKRSILIFPVLLYVFGFIAAFIDTPELAIVYAPILLPVMLKLGYDTITAAAIALCGTISGYIGAMANPFTVGIAQEIAGLERFSGMGYRFVTFMIITAVAAIYVIRYARMVKADPTKSLTYEEDIVKRQELEKNGDKEFVATSQQKLALALTGILFLGMMLCVLIWRWGMVEIGGYFIFMSFVVALVTKLAPSKLAETYDEGFKGMIHGAMICGVCRGVVVVMTEGNIIDSVIHGVAMIIGGLPATINVLGMLILQFFINFFIPSGSGQALFTMPIMAPLSDLIGVTRQTAILAFQFGDGLSNIIFPTSGYFMATLGVVGIKYDKWAKFQIPLQIIWLIVAGALLVIANAIGWQ